MCKIIGSAGAAAHFLASASCVPAQALPAAGRLDAAFVPVCCRGGACPARHGLVLPRGHPKNKKAPIEDPDFIGTDVGALNPLFKNKKAPSVEPGRTFLCSQYTTKTDFCQAVFYYFYKSLTNKGLHAPLSNRSYALRNSSFRPAPSLFASNC